MGGTITRWKIASLSIQVNTLLPNKKGHWRQNLAPWRRGSRIWHYLAKAWNHRLHPELRLVPRFPISICSGLWENYEFDRCNTCLIRVMRHTFDHMRAYRDLTSSAQWFHGSNWSKMSTISFWIGKCRSIYQWPEFKHGGFKYGD